MTSLSENKTIMNKAENSDSIPNDLINEILLRLPPKSIARLRSVSKLWCSMLHRPYFTELFLTRSLSRPRLLFAVEGRGGVWRFFSTTQPQSPYEKSSALVVDTDFHTKLHGRIMRLTCCRFKADFSCSYNYGLIYFSHVCHSKEYKDAVHVICNPITGQYASLPKVRSFGITKWRNYLGFDPIEKQFKVLSMACPSPNGHKILTLGPRNESWRKINCPFNHRPLRGSEKGICINGILYYLAQRIIEFSWENGGTSYKSIGCTSLVIVCFDVRSEEFKFIDAEGFCDTSATLINYKGRLGKISWNEDNAIELCVLKDVEKKERSKYVYTFGDDKICQSSVYVAGMTATGEIVLSRNNSDTSKPFYVFYLNPEGNTLQRVEIQGLVEEHGNGRVYVFVDHVEDFNVIDAKLFKSRPKPEHREEVREKDMDWRYDGGVLSLEKKHRRRNEGDSREDEERRRLRRRRKIIDI